MINFLLPAIKARWPAAERGMPIFIQQDNAKTHIPVDDPEFVAAAQADGWDIRLRCQPPNSPDLNILDLGFFAALQSLFHKLSPGICTSWCFFIKLILSYTDRLLFVQVLLKTLY